MALRPLPRPFVGHLLVPVITCVVARTIVETIELVVITPINHVMKATKRVIDFMPIRISITRKKNSE